MIEKERENILQELDELEEQQSQYEQQLLSLWNFQKNTNQFFDQNQQDIIKLVEKFFENEKEKRNFLLDETTKNMRNL